MLVTGLFSPSPGVTSAGRATSGFDALTCVRAAKAPCFCNAVAWAATVSAICFTKLPSSPISVAKGSDAGRARCAGDAILTSAAFRRRDISATCRARSAVPRERSAIWSPRSVRSRRRVLTVLKRAMPVRAANATIADVLAPTLKPRYSTAPTEAAMSMTQTAIKMALMRRMRLSWALPQPARSRLCD